MTFGGFGRDRGILLNLRSTFQILIAYLVSYAGGVESFHLAESGGLWYGGIALRTL